VWYKGFGNGLSRGQGRSSVTILGFVPAMKATLIKVFIWPSGAAVLIGVSVLTLLLLYWPHPGSDRQASGNREEFPGQRRGGGTHWVNTPLSDTMA
jgi:hypothetical protein